MLIWRSQAAYKRQPCVKTCMHQWQAFPSTEASKVAHVGSAAAASWALAWSTGDDDDDDDDGDDDDDDNNNSNNNGDDDDDNNNNSNNINIK